MRLFFTLLLLVSIATVGDAAEKFPVPQQEELAASYKIINEVFGEQIKAAEDANAKSEIAMSFLTTAATTNDRFEKYALLQQAQTLALEANDFQLYFRTLDAIGETFQIDKVKLWENQLTKLLEGQVDGATLHKLAAADFLANDEPARRNEVADNWYTLAKTMKGPAAQVAKDRAVLHYRAAMPGLAGLEKLRSQKRMQECMENTLPADTIQTATPNERKARYGHGRIIEVDCTKGLTLLEAQKFQKNAARAYGVPVEVTNKIGMRFSFIPAGTFVMGSPEDEPHRKEDEKQHVVKIATPFYLGMTEVTQAQYWKIAGQKPSHHQNLPNNPVEMVTWDNANDFCKKLSELDGKRSYSLPSAEQWEYACRAGTLGATYGPLDKIGWYTSNSIGKTNPVGLLAPNAWGLYDCLGNVWEWCDDAAQYRGGCLWDADWGVRSSLRHPAERNQTRKVVGFRVLFVPEP